MPNPYDAADFTAAAGFFRVHRTAEQTHVAVLQADDDEWAAVAYDVDPTAEDAADRAVAAECIAYGESKADVQAAARQWMTSHPKGVLQDAGEGEAQAGGEGWGAKLIRMLKGLDSYGNDLIEQNQQPPNQ